MIMMNNNLRIFILVAEKGSFTATANELFISQPAISRAIKSLETELNIKLFYRDKRNGLVLTDNGHKILALARQMSNIENHIYQIAFEENNFLNGTIRIASMPIFTSIILSPIFHQFKKKYPHIKIELIEGTSLEIRKAVAEHQVDFGLTASPFGNLSNKILLKDHIIAITIDKSLSDINLEDFSHNYILCYAAQETLAEKLKSHKIDFSHFFVVQQPETVIHLVTQGNGIGIISEFTLDANLNFKDAVSNLNVLRKLPVTPSVEIDVGIIANDFNNLTPIATIFMEMILNECNNYLGFQ